MKYLLSIILITPLTLFASEAEVRSLDNKDSKPLFYLSINESVENEIRKVKAEFKNDKKEIALIEEATINDKTADITDYKIIQNQTHEKCFIEVTSDKIKIKYEAEGKPVVEKNINKPDLLVAPANFEKWLEVNFEKLKKEKAVRIHFLVWERFETIDFKITYLGESVLNGQKVHKFKMNIDNLFLSAFITPIFIWKSEDMTKMIRYEGRIAVKQVKGPKLENLDAEVLYNQSLKAAQ